MVKGEIIVNKEDFFISVRKMNVKTNSSTSQINEYVPTRRNIIKRLVSQF